MATLASTNITRNLLNLKGTSLNIGGCPVEVFYIAAGATPGDTALLVPSTFSNARSVFGPCTNNLPTSQTGASSVTVTLCNAGGTALTSTIGAAHIWVYGPLAQG